MEKRVNDVMKNRKYVTAPIASIVLLLAVTVAILIGASNGRIVESPAILDKTNTSKADSVEVKNKVEQLLQEIMDNGLASSSNPYDYLKDSKAFAELVAMNIARLI